MYEIKEETLNNLALSNLETLDHNPAPEVHEDEHEETHPADASHNEEGQEIHPEHKEN